MGSCLNTVHPVIHLYSVGLVLCRGSAAVPPVAEHFVFFLSMAPCGDGT